MGTGPRRIDGILDPRNDRARARTGDRWQLPIHVGSRRRRRVDDELVAARVPVRIDEPALDSAVATVRPYYEETHIGKCGDGGLMLQSHRRGADQDLAHARFSSLLLSTFASAILSPFPDNLCLVATTETMDPNNEAVKGCPQRSLRSS